MLLGGWLEFKLPTVILTNLQQSLNATRQTVLQEPAP
jgi:hypothetical protein